MKHKSLFILVLGLTFLTVAFAQDEDVTTNENWRTALGGQITNVQAEGLNGMIYVIADDQAVHSIYPMTGNIRWTYRPGLPLKDYLAVGPDGTIYIQNQNNEIFALNPGGNARWKCILRVPTLFRPVIGPDGTLVFALNNGKVAGITPYGELDWTTILPANASTSPIGDSDGIIYLADTAGNLNAIDSYGEIMWTTSTGVIRNLVQDGTDYIYGITEQGELLMIDRSGNMVFKSSANYQDASLLLVSQRDVWIGLSDGRIFKVNSTSENLLYQASSGIKSGSLGSKGLYFQLVSGEMLYLPFVGDAEAIASINGDFSDPLLTEGLGHLITGGTNWKVYSYPASRPIVGWTQFRGNSQRSGCIYNFAGSYDDHYYDDDGRWHLFNAMIDSHEVEQQQQIIDIFAEYGDDTRALKKEYPFYDIILARLADQGGKEVRLLDGQVVNDHPLIRTQAYDLLGQNDALYVRELLLASLIKERDTLVLSAGYRALARIGSDSDGRSLKVIHETLEYNIGLRDERLCFTAVEAIVDIIHYNGYVTSSYGIAAFSVIMEWNISDRLNEYINEVYREIYLYF